MDYDNSAPEYVGNGFVDPFAKAAEESKTDDLRGLLCETKIYEKRYNHEGKQVLLQSGSRLIRNVTKDRDYDAAILMVKTYDSNGNLNGTELRIQSPHLKKAMKEVIKYYPGMNLDASHIVIIGQPRCFFHYRKELVQYALTLVDVQAVQHLQFALNMMYQMVEEAAMSWFTWVEPSEDMGTSPGLEFDHLWTAFRPGILIYHKFAGNHVVAHLWSMSQVYDNWHLSVREIVYNGKKFGYRSDTWMISRYSGVIPFTELSAFPLEYHPEQDQIFADAIARGKRYVQLRGWHHLSYRGEAELHSRFGKYTAYRGQNRDSLYTRSVSARIIVDFATYAMSQSTDRITINSDLSTHEVSDDNITRWKERDYAICSYQVPAFSLKDKCWGFFDIDRLSEVEYSEDAFDRLLLPQGQKDIVFSLVKAHDRTDRGFDDIIQGKDRGMILLLHGVPGVGKTITAESVADYVKRPLYTVNSRDLGVEDTVVEKKLLNILQLAEKWKAIVLIDEADIFLEQRSATELQRNALVSVFLRVLEYYEGIMILTTNRVKKFDEAFKSRIHMAIKYNSLDFHTRRELWKYFVNRAIDGHTPSWLTDECLDKVAAEELNGRQIRNIVRMAHALAVGTETDLSEGKLLTSLESMKQFEEVMNDAGNHDKHGESTVFHYITPRKSRKRRRRCEWEEDSLESDEDDDLM